MNYVKRWSCFVHTCPPLRWGFVQKSHWNAPCSNDRRWRISCWLTTSKSVRRRQTKSFTAVRYVDRAPGRCQNVPAGRVPVDQTLPQILFFFLGERIKLNVKSWEADSEKTSRCWSSESFFFSRATCCSFHGRTVLSGDVECGGNMAANCTCHVFLSPALLMTSSFNLNQCD